MRRSTKRRAMSPVVPNVRMRGVAAVATVPLLAAACGGDEPTSAPAAERSTTSVKAPTTTGASTTTTTDVGALDTGGEDFDRVVRNIIKIRNAAYFGPRPELIDRVYTPDCNCLPREREALAGLVRRNVRYVEPLMEILEVEVVARPNPDSAELRVTDKAQPSFVIDASGKRTPEGESWEPTTRIWTVIRVAGQWKLQRVQTEGPVEGDGT